MNQVQGIMHYITGGGANIGDFICIADGNRMTTDLFLRRAFSTTVMRRKTKVLHYNSI